MCMKRATGTLKKLAAAGVCCFALAGCGHLPHEIETRQSMDKIKLELYCYDNPHAARLLTAEELKILCGGDEGASLSE